jgi:hypothetical protein
LGVWGFGGDFGFSARRFVGRKCSGEGLKLQGLNNGKRYLSGLKQKIRAK